MKSLPRHVSYQRFSEHGVQFVAVSNENAEQVRQFLEVCACKGGFDFSAWVGNVKA